MGGRQELVLPGARRGNSLVVRSRGCVSFPNGAVLHAHATARHAIELMIGFVVEELGQIFGRRIQYRERLQLIEHLVVDAVDYWPHHLLEQLEVEQETGLIEHGTGQGHADFIVVAVRVLALAFVIPEVVPGAESGLHGNFKHWSWLNSGREDVPLSFILAAKDDFMGSPSVCAAPPAGQPASGGPPAQTDSSSPR